MALGTFRPGEYTMTYGGVAVGMCTSGGKNLRFRRKSKPINDTDRYGLSTIDHINCGADCFLTCTFKEWNAGVKDAIWPYGTAAFDGLLGLAGVLDSSKAKTIVLTAVANTPAAAAGPATLTATHAILAPENDTNVIFGIEETDVPVVFQLLPYDSSGIRFFTLT